MDENIIGSAGTLIGAAMEWAGHYIQSQMLDVINSTLSTSLGGLLFTMSAITAITIIAVGGHYKFGSWFLVGPALFYFIVADNNRVQSDRVIWKFADRIHTQSLVDDSLRSVRPKDTSEPVKVAWFFARWNQFTSGLARAMERAVGVSNISESKDAKSDLDLITKLDKYNSVFAMEVGDPNLQKFIKLVTLHPVCTELYSLQQLDINEIKGDDASVLSPEFRKKRIERLKKFPATYPHAKNWKYLRNLCEQGFFGDECKNDPERELFKVCKSNRTEEQGSTTVTRANSCNCEDLWKLSIEALKDEAKINLSQIAASGKYDGFDNKSALIRLAEKWEDPDSDAIEDETEDQELSRKLSYLINFSALKMIQNTMDTIRPSASKYHMSAQLQRPQGKLWGDDSFNVHVTTY